MTENVIPLFDMELRIRKHRNLIEESINRVLNSSQVILGQEVERFEELFARYQGASFCISVANGTDAIELSLRCLGVARHSYVGVTANAGGYSRIAIESIGANAIYADVDQETNCISLSGAIDLINRGAKTIIVTHLYGRVTPDVSAIANYCKQMGVNLIEDCAQAHGSTIDGVLAGSFGDLATFSFYPTKNLGGIGDGGCITTNSVTLGERLRGMRTYGWATKYEIQTLGGRNSRLDALQAAILADLLPFLDEENEQRRALARYFANNVRNEYLVLMNSDDLGCNFHLFLTRSRFRDQLRIHLESHSIKTAIHYPIPDHKQKCWASSSNFSLPVTEQLAKQILTIPLYPDLSMVQASRIVQVLNDFSPD
jgi:aminotransferase EvaB